MAQPAQMGATIAVRLVQWQYLQYKWLERVQSWIDQGDGPIDRTIRILRTNHTMGKTHQGNKNGTNPSGSRSLPKFKDP